MPFRASANERIDCGKPLRGRQQHLSVRRSQWAHHKKDSNHLTQAKQDCATLARRNSHALLCATSVIAVETRNLPKSHQLVNSRTFALFSGKIVEQLIRIFSNPNLPQ